MTLEQLRIFIAVAEREHLTKGAQALGLTPSATSAAIAALEARHATLLFDRMGRRIVLTDAGRRFLVEARAVLAQVAAAEQVLVDLSGMARGRLAIACSQTVANYWLPRVVERYRAAHPGIAIAIEIGNSDFVTANVREGKADLGIVEGEIDDPVLAAVAVAQDEMVLVAPVAHPWAWRAPREAAEWREGPWLLREPGSGTRAILEAHLSALGLSLGECRVVLEYPSNEALRAAVEAGSGVTMLSRRVVDSALRGGTMAAIDVPTPSRAFLALHHRERYMNKAAQAFIDLAQRDE